MVDLDAPDALTTIRHELKEAGSDRICTSQMLSVLVCQLMVYST